MPPPEFELEACGTKCQRAIQLASGCLNLVEESESYKCYPGMLSRSEFWLTGKYNSPLMLDACCYMYAVQDENESGSIEILKLAKGASLGRKTMSWGGKRQREFLRESTCTCGGEARSESTEGIFIPLVESEANFRGKPSAELHSHTIQSQNLPTGNS
ncbi:hypothetical protein CEXT_508751 [Caerostris extrusa]|uniref:Uncharacterized protein n=1 Tax=Caerostris extrusa TaxID=172846 RepID=A0AAV4W621_CAEEX|nr:hypothetical protein CEXT_508751 [Caerostris extrusa]